MKAESFSVPPGDSCGGDTEVLEDAEIGAAAASKSNHAGPEALELENVDSLHFYDIVCPPSKASTVGIPSQVSASLFSHIFEGTQLSVQKLGSDRLPIKLCSGSKVLTAYIKRYTSSGGSDRFVGYRLHLMQGIYRHYDLNPWDVFRLKYIGRELSGDRTFCFDAQNVGQLDESAAALSEEAESSDGEDPSSAAPKSGNRVPSTALPQPVGSKKRAGNPPPHPSPQAPLNRVRTRLGAAAAAGDAEEMGLQENKRKKGVRAAPAAAPNSAAAAAPAPAATQTPPAMQPISPALPVIMECADSIRINQEVLRRLQLAGERFIGQQQAQAQVNQVLSSFRQAISKGKATEIPAGGSVFWEGAAVERSVSGSNFGVLSRCSWASTDVPMLSDAVLSRLQTCGAEISPELALLLTGDAVSFRLFVGSPQGGQRVGVYALDPIPAGRWVLQWIGEYREGAGAAGQGLYSIRSGGGGSGCAIPVSAGVTDQQRKLCARLPRERIEGDQNTLWRRMPGAVLDSRRRGNAVRFLRRAAEGANLEAVEIDLPHGPTGVFLCSARAIAAGEALVLQE